MKWLSRASCQATRDVRLLTGSAYVPRLPGLVPSIAFQPMPSAGEPQSLLECTLERAEELALAGVNSVLWSGGIDSSLAALAISRERPVTLLVTSETYAVAPPRMFDLLSERGCTFHLTNGIDLGEQVRSGAVFATGTHGDDLFLGDHSIGLVDRVWDMEVEQMLAELSGRGSTGRMWDYYRYLFEPMPLEKTAANCLWWVGFCFQWHWASCYLTMSNDLGAPGVTHHHFFDSVPFQRWMMQDASLRSGRTAVTHKQKAVEVCVELAGEPLEFLPKTGGWDLIRRHDLPAVISADADWNFKRATQ